MSCTISSKCLVGRETVHLGASMRRPIRVKSFFTLSRRFFHFFRSAKPPLSPPFHPHSYLSDFRSVPVGCSSFNRCCYLVRDLCFPLL